MIDELLVREVGHIIAEQNIESDSEIMVLQSQRMTTNRDLYVNTMQGTSDYNEELDLEQEWDYEF